MANLIERQGRKARELSRKICQPGCRITKCVWIFTSHSMRPFGIQTGWLFWSQTCSTRVNTIAKIKNRIGKTVERRRRKAKGLIRKEWQPVAGSTRRCWRNLRENLRVQQRLSERNRQSFL